MKSVTYFECPVCGKRSCDKKVVTKCLHSHSIKSEEYIYCNICGQGWNTSCWKRERAIDYAEKCEQQHIKAGDSDRLASLTYFSSGGTLGYVEPVKGKETMTSEESWTDLNKQGLKKLPKVFGKLGGILEEGKD